MQDQRERIAAARELMARFAGRTGIATAAGRHRRYLWTDAFAVCNFLSLHRATGEGQHLQTALLLVDRVHEALGRHREDDARTGWISGLPEDEGRAHPTRGGLRIGKAHAERRAGEPFDERLEWDRDGQYFHYLTRWMHALARVAAATRSAQYLHEAVELAEAAHAAFTWTHAATGQRRMYWKMSIDLRRPLVPSMGHHDPLDGLLTFAELQCDLTASCPEASRTRLDAATLDLRAIGRSTDWTTDDPLGIGGLLTGAGSLAQQLVRGPGDPGDHELLARLLQAAAAGLGHFCWRSPLALPARQRLAFRELGLAIGLAAVPRLEAVWERIPEPVRDRARPHLARLGEHLPLGAAIEDCWLDPGNRALASWTEHLDINEVMLATSLLPEEYLAV